MKYKEGDLVRVEVFYGKNIISEVIDESVGIGNNNYSEEYKLRFNHLPLEFWIVSRNIKGKIKKLNISFKHMKSEV